MPADTTSVFYQVGQAVSTQISSANTSFLGTNNTFTGTQTFADIIISSGNTIQLTDHTDHGVLYSDTAGNITSEAGFTYNAGTDLLTAPNLTVSTGGSLKVVDLTANRVVTAGTGGALSDSANLTFDGTTLAVTGSATVSQDVTITGNLTVNGTTTSLQTTNTEIKDNLIILNEGANDTSSEANDGGILFERASGTQNAAFLFEESQDRFEVGLTDGTGDAVSLGNVSLGALAVNSLLIGTRASTQALGDYADFTAGLNA